MKTGLKLIALVAFAAAVVSCNKKDDNKFDPNNYPSTANFATAYLTADEKDYYFELDDDKLLYVSDRAIAGDYKPEHEERMILYYSPTGSKIEIEDKEMDQIKLFNVNSVLTAEGKIVTNETENSAIGNDVFTDIATSAKYNSKYLNIYVKLTTIDIDECKFYIVKNTFEDPDKTKKNYLNLELRYERAKGAGTGKDYEKYLSCDLAEFAADLEGKDGILLKVETSENGTAHIEIKK